jgi:phage tail-like protein
MKLKNIGLLTILCGLIMISLTSMRETTLRGQSGETGSAATGSPDSFVFQLELEGQGVVGEYTECFGLGSSNVVEEAVVQTEGGAMKKKTPGPLEWQNITLKRIGPSDGQVWSSWRKAIEDGKLEDGTRNGAIVMFKADSSEPLAKWNFMKGWPASLTIEGSAEVLTIVHDGLERVAPTDERRVEPGLR